jgi:hypothetical protein
MENVDIFCGPLEYCTAIRYMLRHIGIFCGILVCFFPVSVCLPGKNLAILMHCSL